MLFLWGGILSGPAALLGSILDKRLKTPLMLIVRSEMSGAGSLEKCGRGDWSSLVKTETILFTGNRDHINKSKETRVVAYTCRYSSGQLIPIF